MKPRLIILIVIALGVAIYWANQTASPSASKFEEGLLRAGPRPTYEKELRDRDLPGEEPEEPAEITFTYYVDSTGRKNRIYFTLYETHGYYVETFEIRIWYKQNPDTEFEDSVLPLTHYENNYIPAGGELSACIELAPGELDNIPSNSMGVADDWGFDVVDWGRAREKNPDPLPELRKVARCD